MPTLADIQALQQRVAELESQLAAKASTQTTPRKPAPKATAKTPSPKPTAKRSAPKAR